MPPPPRAGWRAERAGGTLKFLHRVRVNDPATPAATVSFDQLWRGLVLKAENPLLFVEALDGYRILARDGACIERELRFGDATIRDRVVLDTPGRMRQEIAPSPHSGPATLRIRIDAAGDDGLAVEFDYDTSPATADDDEARMVEAYVRQAYIEADRHAIAVIRRLVGEGRL